jgi:hypothetical protein
MTAFENTMLRGIFGPMSGVITEEWRIHNEELNDIYCSPNVIRVVKSRRMRTEGHVACIGKMRGVYRVFVGKPVETSRLGKLRRRREDNNMMDLQVGWGQVAGTCKCGNEPSDSIKLGEFFDLLRNRQLLKKDCSME